MTKFEKICAVLTIPVGAIFMVLGITGVFLGSSANFTLPPILGVLPLFLGWNMCVTLIRYWRSGTGTSTGSKPDAAKRPRPSSPIYLRFLDQYPEFRNAPIRVQWNGFHSWLESGGAHEEP